VSLVITKSLFCDGPGRPGDGGSCPTWFAENTDDYAAAIRARAKRMGWSRRRTSGRSLDLSPECSRLLDNQGPSQ
jgi:hypothetical protein